ncbi:histidine phosphatase family protein [Halomonas alkalisoli]|uniref:histidine phosphatase family protein n=1 Tax=Halomonas alkalisoli TaxID=2907158 RepID=UPI001F3DAADD|nr:histidine phosphatase family protein [Halomonas alkalisoli]MCE9684436.1 histidine phosphatase family protein [Halomonas alkalisoli]
MDSTTLELVIVRHGLTDWNREQRYQGQRDIPLLLPDALDAMDRLRDQLADERFEAVYCSDLTRCRQTLAHVWSAGDASCESRFDARLRELDFGDYEGMRYADLKDELLYREWIDSRGEQAPPGGESTAALRQRLGAWLTELFLAAEAEGHRRILTVTHGGVIRELRRRFEAIDFWDGSVGQAQGRRLTFTHRQGGWQCSSSLAVPAPASVRP